MYSFQEASGRLVRCFYDLNSFDKLKQSSSLSADVHAI